MNRCYSFLILISLTLICSYTKAEIKAPIKIDTIFACDSLVNSECSTTNNIPNNQEVLKLTIKDSITYSKFKSKKLIAAILSFPVPFGLLGLHRIFLGTKPYIPFVYIGTVGGCFLILPVIDFINIISADEETFKRFETNPRVFMWQR